MKLSEQLRQHLKNGGLTMYAVSKQTGIDQAALSKFRLGHRGLSWDAADKIGELLGLKVIATKQPKQRKVR